jgi:hypothetical protein
MWKPISVKILAAALLGSVLAGAGARAATFDEDTSIGCAITLKGEIIDGDLDRLRKAASRQNLLSEPDSGEESNASDRALCLDSPGGNYVAGRLMAGLIHQFGITTRVEAGASCYSACAFMFMAGRSLGGEVDGASRYMHARANVGFHAPYLKLDETAAISGGEAMRTMEALNKVIGEFIKFGSYISEFDSRPMFSMSLLAETLSSGPAEMTKIGTIEAAARWGVNLEGIRPTSIITHQAAANACLNFQAWMMDKSSIGENFEYYHSQPETAQRVTLWGDEVTMAKIDTGGMEERYCLVGISNKPVTGFAVCSRDGFNGVSFGDCQAGYAHYVPWYYSMPPNTPIADIALP